MAKPSASAKVPSRLLALRRLNSTSGGSSDTELKELQVRPAGRPSAARVVMTATPVGKQPSSCRNSFGSMALRKRSSTVCGHGFSDVRSGALRPRRASATGAATCGGSLAISRCTAGMMTLAHSSSCFSIVGWSKSPICVWKQ